LALDSLGRVWVIEVKRDIDRQQLSQTLEYAGWAYSTNLDEVAALYSNGLAAFFEEWPKFTASTTPVVVSHASQLLLIARDIHSRTEDALRFLAASGVPVIFVPVSLYEDDSRRRLVDIERESVVTSELPTDHDASRRAARKIYKIHGHLVRILDLVEAGLLAAETEIELAEGSNTARGVVTERGTIRIGENAYPTPSGAAFAVVKHSVDGWTAWRVPSAGDKSLADLRLQLIDLVAAEEGS
jgi:hypothetical protein